MTDCGFPIVSIDGNIPVSLPYTKRIFAALLGSHNLICSTLEKIIPCRSDRYKTGIIDDESLNSLLRVQSDPTLTDEKDALCADNSTVYKLSYMYILKIVTTFNACELND